MFAQESELLRGEIFFVALLSIGALVAILVRRIRLPYTVALVLVGLGLSLIPTAFVIDIIEGISGEVFLALLVPPLIFEATLHIKWDKLKKDLVPVLLLAVLGTLIGSFVVGSIVNQVLGIPFFAALAFGALISATDPVAVIAFFRNLGVSKRLSLLVEGESLFNDGVSIVLFTLAISAASMGGIDTSISDWLITAVGEFLQVALGGLFVGTVLGFIVSYVILKNVDDHLIETATTVALTFGAYVVAEEFHLSGILAVVAAGLMVGNIGSQNTSPTTQLTLENFWEFLAFAVNAIIFLLLGLEIQVDQFVFWPIAVAVVAVLLTRALLIYGITGLHGLFEKKKPIPMPYRHVMFWGGLRGAISLALALTLTAEKIGGDPLIATELRVMTFGVVLFTLLIQGVTIERLIRHLGLADRPQPRVELQRRLGRLYAHQSGKDELERLRSEGILFRDVGEAMATVYSQEFEGYRQALRQHMQKFPELELEMYLQAREDVLRAERNAFGDALRRGFISEDVYDELIREADNRTAALAWISENRDLGPAYIERKEDE